MSVQHFAVDRRGPFGGTMHTTLCRRARLGSDGTNRTNAQAEVTCKFCLALLKAQGQTRAHHCHWPGCSKQVPPAMWGCRAHWFRLPAHLRAKVWAAYQPGQETDGTPSPQYIAVAHEVQGWIAAQGQQEQRNG